MRLFYNGRCIRPMSKDCAMKPKTSSKVVEKQLVAKYKFDKSIYNASTDSRIYKIPQPVSFNYGFIDTGIQLLKNDSDWTMFLDCIPNIDNKPQAVIHCLDEIGTCPGISFSFENGYINFYDGESGTTIGNGNYLNKNIKVVIVKKGTDIIIYHNDDPVYQMDSPITIPYTFKSINSTLSIGGGHLRETPMHPFTGAINNFVLYNKALEAQECNSIINNGLLPEIASSIYQIPESITFNNSGFMDTGIQLLKNDSNWSLFLDCIPNLNDKTQAVIHCVDENNASYPGISFSFEPNGNIGLYDGTKGTLLGNGDYLNKNIKIVIVKKDSNILVYHNNDPIYQATSPIIIPYTFKSANTTLSIGGGHIGALALHTFSGVINNFVIYNKALEAQECYFIINNKIAEYKFDNTLYDLIPEFNEGFTYTYEDIVDGEITTRTIYSDGLPTMIRFGDAQNDEGVYRDKQKSLLEVTYMNTSALNTMDKMFYKCINVQKIDCDWDTSNVIDMKAMFYDCKSLTSLDVSNFDTSNVTDMRHMFYKCNSLTSLDLSNWDTSNVTTMMCMFSNCYSLASLDVSKWVTSNVISMESMFSYDYMLTTLDVSNWNIGKVVNIFNIFGSCQSLTQLNVSNWDTSNVENMGYMFYDCQSLTSLDVRKWDTSNVIYMFNTFCLCESLTQLDVSNWKTSNVITMEYMFGNCRSLTQLDVSNWDTSKVTNMSNMLSECHNLTSISMNNSDCNSVNKIIEQLPTRTSDSMGTLDIIGIDDIKQVNINSAESKYWIVKFDEPTNIYIGNIIASALYLGDIKINSCYLGDQKIL